MEETTTLRGYLETAKAVIEEDLEPEKGGASATVLEQIDAAIELVPEPPVEPPETGYLVVRRSGYAKWFETLEGVVLYDGDTVHFRGDGTVES